MAGHDSGSGAHVLTLDGEIEELERLESFLDTFCEALQVPAGTCSELHVALEELVANAIKHGRCEPKRGAIQLTIRRTGDQVNAVLSDTGIAFNPLDAPAPELSVPLCDRPLGGLGIHLVRHLLPSIRYERTRDRNYIYFTKPVYPADTVSPEEKTHANGDGNNPG